MLASYAYYMYIVCMPKVMMILGKFSVIVIPGDHSPAHVHVKGSGAELKFNLETGKVYWSRGFNQPTVNQIEKVLKTYITRLQEAWDDTNK